MPTTDRLRRAGLATLAALLLLPGLARAEAFGIRQPDALRLADLNAHLGAALRQAYAEAGGDTLDAVRQALSGPALPIEAVAPEGDWNCRTIKLGGITPGVAYGTFRCRIEALGPGLWRLTKLTGSQRLVGEIAALEGMELRFTGVGHVGAAPATDYGGLPPEDQTPVEPNQTFAVVGILEQMSPTRARLLLPAPVLESRFDLLYLTR